MEARCVDKLRIAVEAIGVMLVSSSVFWRLLSTTCGRVYLYLKDTLITEGLRVRVRVRHRASEASEVWGFYCVEVFRGGEEKMFDVSKKVSDRYS